MKYPIEISTAPSTEPLTLQEAKDYFREDRSVEDTLIQQFVSAARRSLERNTGYVLIDTVFKMYLQDFEDVKLPKNPIKSGSVSVEYVDSAGAAQTLATDKYNVHEVESPVGIEFLSGLPDTDDDTKYPVIITFTAGYGASESDVPEDWKMAMAMVSMIMWLRNMGETQLDPINNSVVQAYLQDYKIGRFK